MAILTDILNDFTSNIDPKHEDYIVSSPDFFCSFILFYVFSIRVLGPKLMKHRQPYNIKNIVIGYNVIQILVNIYILYECIHLYFTNPNWICIDARNKDDFADISKHYYFLKLFDIVETMFFILRKSYRQASFLHLYHHSGISFAAFVNFRYNYGETTVMIGLLNVGTHVLMYIYYLLTAVDSTWRNNVTIKKGLTSIQIIQLNLMWIYFGLTKITPGCKAMPRYVLYTWTGQNLFMVSLFLRFYFKTYVKKVVSVSKEE
ncbi:very long chain fatty acid elongase F-like [Diabrotica undecimpunctata]|uniref:very long chain fatty acid elongase F-like n=1 Tax=Diabrotica undecimpunctata TaxID=50387 RepID=UPI003B632286